MGRSQIKRLNPKLALPSTAIAPVYRSDGFGDEFSVFGLPLQNQSKFQSSIGANTSVQWPTGIGAKATRVWPT